MTGQPGRETARSAAAPTLPDNARTIVVPISNPDTAEELLTIAVAVASEVDATVIGLVVLVGGDEEGMEQAREGALADVVRVVDDRHQGVIVRLEPVIATSIARGILDQAREARADLLVLGVGPPVDGQVDLGVITSSVLETAACGVLVYRPSLRGGLSDVRGVVIAAEAGPGSRPTAQTGIQVSRGLGLPVEITHVVSPGVPTAIGRQRLRETVEGLHAEGVRRTVLHGQDPAEAILSRTSYRDLVVTGLPPRDERLTRALGGVCRELFDGARGPVIGIARRIPATGIGGRLEQWQHWLRPELTTGEQATIVWQAQRTAAPSLDFVVLMMVSAVLAALGLLLNSAAVIIGAMLVAPLMGPLVASAVGITTAKPGIASRSWGTVVIGAGAAALVTIITGLLAGVSSPTSEMLARGSPSLLDAAVALASGVAGAYATARKDIPAALAGVAIAAALVPPLCVSALGLVLGDGSLALGAGLLFLTNIICIAGMAGVVFWWLGMRPADATVGGRRWAPVLLIGVVSALIAVVVFDVSSDVSNQARTSELVESSLPGVEVVDIQTQGVSPPRIVITIRAPEPPDDSALGAVADALAEEYGRQVDVRLVFQQVLELP